MVKKRLQTHMKNKCILSFWYGFNLTAIILTGFFILLVPVLQAYIEYRESVDIGMRQGDTSFVHTETPIAITIDNTFHTPLNAFEFELVYNPKELHITKIVPLPTLCEDRFILTNTINNASGTSLFQCGTITPFSNTTGTIAIVYVMPLIQGTTSLRFGSTTHVLAHDGYGTDATKGRNGISLTSL